MSRESQVSSKILTVLRSPSGIEQVKELLSIHVAIAARRIRFSKRTTLRVALATLGRPNGTGPFDESLSFCLSLNCL